MQRREAGEHREAHAQPRVRGATPDRERVPRRLHLCHVVRQRRPPRRDTAPPVVPGPAGPGVGPPSSGALRRSSVSSTGPRRSKPPARRARRPRRRRRRSPGRAACERRRVGLGEADRGPRAEAGRQRGDPVVVRLEQRLGLSGGSASMPSGTDGATSARSRPSPSSSAARRRVVVGEVDGAPPARRSGAAPSPWRGVRASAAPGGGTAHAAAARATGAGGCRSRGST